jgi:hypothetical protein
MASYININGNNIPIRASDPANPIEGEVWYNSTTNALKAQSVTTAGAWASAPAFPVAARGGYGFGTPLAGLTAGGINSGGAVFSESYEWNGSAWTATGNLTTSGFIGGGGGTQTSAVYSGFGDGSPPAPTTTNDYDGNSWASGNPLNTSRYYGKGGGPTSAVLLVGGNGDPGIRNQMEFYDGTSWASQPQSLNVVRSISGGAGNQTDAIVWQGGSSPGFTNTTEVWNGSAWTLVNNFLIASSGSGYGDGQTDNSASAVSLGNGDPENGNVYVWDGTCWAADTSMSNGRGTAYQLGGKPSALYIGGFDGSPANTTDVEEWTGAGSPQTVTISFT